MVIGNKCDLEYDKKLNIISIKEQLKKFNYEYIGKK